MRFIQMIVQIIILYFFYYIGVLIQKTFHLSIPGSVIGMMLLLVLLLTGKFQFNWLENGANFLIKHLPFLFLPITVGLLNHLDLFKGSGFWTIFIVLFSTILVMLSSSTTMHLLARRKRGIESE